MGEGGCAGPVPTQEARKAAAMKAADKGRSLIDFR